MEKKNAGKGGSGMEKQLKLDKKLTDPVRVHSHKRLVVMEKLPGAEERDMRKNEMEGGGRKESQ